MKQIKIFGLVALTALMITALASASSAMAEGSTVLCKTDETPCASANRISHIHLEGLFLILSSFATVHCEGLLLAGILFFLRLHLSGTYTCLNSCTATEENGPSEWEVLKLGSELADVTGEGLVHVVCGLNCRYNGVGLTGHGLGALTSSNEIGEIVISEAVLNKESGTFCPSTSKLDAVFEPLEALYISYS